MIVFHLGTGRAVLPVPQLGLALKFPRVHWRKAWLIIRTFRFKHRRHRMGLARGEHFMSSLRRALFNPRTDFEASLRNALIGGLRANWREYRFYRTGDRVRRRLLQPTYFSFFGLLNIQKYGKPMKARDLRDPKFGELYNCYFAVVGSPLAKDVHLFADERNFHFDVDGAQIRLLDYGDRATQKILTEFGSALIDRFKPPDTSEY